MKIGMKADDDLTWEFQIFLFLEENGAKAHDPEYFS